MNTFGQTTFTDEVLLSQPASADQHPVRLGELTVLLSGTAPVSHTHLLADLTDWANLAPYVAARLKQTPSLSWALSDGNTLISGAVKLKAGGGVVQTSEGLAVNLTGVYAAASHTHGLADVTDFDTQHPAKAFALLSGTQSVAWTLAANRIQADVRRKTNGALGLGVDGLFVELGTSATTAAAGNHTHAQLHDAFTLSPPSSTIAFSLVGQALTGEVRLEPEGGLRVADVLTLAGAGTSGMNGQYTRTTPTHWDQIGGTNFISFHDDAWFVRDEAGDDFYTCPPEDFPEGPWTLADFGDAPVPTVTATQGVGCEFGVLHYQVARGDHTHAQLHDPVTVVNTLALSLQIDGNQVLSGAVRCDPAPAGGRGKLGIGVSGLYVELGTSVDQAAAGNHTHSAATTSTDGFMSAADKLKVDQIHNPVTTLGTSSLTLGVDANQVLSGAVKRDPLPPGGKLGLSASGLYVELGTSGDQAAAGNHTHTLKETARAVLDGNGSVLLSGVRDYFVMPYAATLTGWEIISDVAVGGTTEVDVWKDTYANFPPTAADSISGTEKPALLSGTQINRDLDLATWAAALAEGDVLCFNVDRAVLARRIVVQLFFTR